MRRETSVYEKAVYIFGDQVPMFFAFRVKVKGNIKKDDLENALIKLQQRHPMARVRVELTKDNKQFVDTNGVPKIPVEEYTKEWADWISIIKQDLCNPFDVYKGPLIRVHLVQRQDCSDVIVVFHHAIVDGISGVLFLHELFLFISNPNKSIEPFENTPTLVELIQDDIMNIIKKRELPDWIKNRDSIKFDDKLKKKKKDPYPHPDFANHHWFFTEQETNNLVKKSKENNISVHGILGAVFLKAIAMEVGKKEGYNRILNSPVNFRPFLKNQAKDIFGLFNGLLDTNVDCSPNRDIWDIAKDIYNDLKNRINNYNPIDMYYFHDKYSPNNIKDFELLLGDRPKQPKEYDFSLSNLGRIQMQKNYGKYEIEKVYGPIFSSLTKERVIGVNTFDGKMFFTFIYNKKSVDHELCKKIRQNAMDIFYELFK